MDEYMYSCENSGLEEGKKESIGPAEEETG